MKKRFGMYAAAWAVLLALFNVIAFVSVGWIGYEKYTGAFWAGYVSITVMFIAQLACAAFALKETNAKRLFYKLSLVTTSYAGLVCTFIVGGLSMLLSALPYWAGIIACAIVLAGNIIAIVKAAAAVAEVERIDQKVQQQTFFIRSLTVDTQNLLARAKDEQTKAACKEVYEAVRYSDPMSNDMLHAIENQITASFTVLSEAVKVGDTQAAGVAAKEVLLLVGERNQKCKLLK